MRFPWRQTFRDRNIWLLGLITTCAAFTSYLYFSWYPKYLQEAYGLNIRQAGWLTSMVLGAGAVGTLGGGLLVDRAVRRGRDPVRARRHLGATALLLAAGLLLVSSRCEDPVLSAGLAAASCLAMLGQQSAWWSTATEVSGRHVGALFGLMNGMGIFGAMGSQYFFGAYADWRLARGFEGRAMWSPAFLVYVALLVVGALCWFYVDPSARRGDREGRGERGGPVPHARGRGGAMRARVNDTELYFDVDGSALVPDGDRMAERPVLFLLHGGPGSDHSVFKPAYTPLRDVAQLVYHDMRGCGRTPRPTPGPARSPGTSPTSTPCGPTSGWSGSPSWAARTAAWSPWAMPWNIPIGWPT